MEHLERGGREDYPRERRCGPVVGDGIEVGSPTADGLPSPVAEQSSEALALGEKISGQLRELLEFWRYGAKLNGSGVEEFVYSQLNEVN